MDSNIISAILVFGSLAPVILFPCINCSKEIRDAAESGQFLDSFHKVLDCGFGSSFVQEDQNIVWEMSTRGFNSISGPKMALTFLDLYGNSTPNALSVCDLIGDQRVLVIICTLTSSYEGLWIAGMDDFITNVPTSCGELVLPKAKLETAPSVLYLIRHTSKKVSCFIALISSFNFTYWEKTFDENITFHRDHIDSVTLNFTSLATHSRTQKLWGLIDTDEASLSTTSSLPLLRTWFDYIGCKPFWGNSFSRNFRGRQGRLPCEKAVFQIGVLVRSNVTQFVSVNNDDNHKINITGFSIDVFEAAVKRLPYKITYKLIPFDGSSDELVKKVARKTFDVGVGDIVTTAGQDQSVEFSLPYFEPGFMMVVKAKANVSNNFWWFLSPFTPELWVLIVASSVLVGTVIWIIEGQYENGPAFLEALFIMQRRPLRNNASRLLSALWLFLVLILTQVYTSMFTALLTNSQQESSIPDIDSLKWTNAAIGCDGQSQTISYLVKVLGFKRRNIKIIASTDGYAEALSSGNIKAAFLLASYAEVLLTKHCADFIEMKPSYGYSLGGFGFVFPNGSHLASDISAAILELEESGELQQMEEEMLSFSDCSKKLFDDTTIRPIGPSSFRGIFVLCGSAWVIALLIALIKLLHRDWGERIQRMLIGRELWLWLAGMPRGLMGREF